MIKLILLSFIIVSLYSDTKYFLDYKDNDTIKTIELKKEKYLKVKNNLEFYKDTNKKVLWSYGEGKDYKILRVYETKEEKKEEVLKVQKDIKEPQIKEINKKVKSEDKKTNFIPIIILILIIFLIYKKFKNNKQNKEVEEVFKEEKEEVFTYDFTELEKKRVEIYKELKYNKNIDKEKKKDLYKNINLLKSSILKKEDLEKLNSELKEIIKRVQNGKN